MPEYLEWYLQSFTLEECIIYPYGRYGEIAVHASNIIAYSVDMIWTYFFFSAL